jgi:hypothetical protein
MIEIRRRLILPPVTRKIIHPEVIAKDEDNIRLRVLGENGNDEEKENEEGAGKHGGGKYGGGNIQHPTPNIQHPIFPMAAGIHVSGGRLFITSAPIFSRNTTRGAEHIRYWAIGSLVAERNPRSSFPHPLRV